MLPRINYITNLKVQNHSGGWSAMNHYLYDQLGSKFNINLIQEIDPPDSLFTKIHSKSFRAIGLRGAFPAFTNKRLLKISDFVHARLLPAEMNFYHGSTPWLRVKNTIPYAVYLDASFITYINIYHDALKFNSRQIDRIVKSEVEFLKNAKAVFFSSEWSKQETLKQYTLQHTNFHFAGLGGGFSRKSDKTNNVRNYFLFVGHDFTGKGGEIIIKAFKLLKLRFPQFALKVVGQKPPNIFLQQDGVEYEGVFDRTNLHQQEALINLFKEAYCVLLPTAKDITPLVLIEAANFGCPVISTKAFGIPEIVKNGVTGILLDKNSSMESQLFKAMLRLCNEPHWRDEMGANAKSYVANQFTWEKVGERITNILLK